MKINWWRECRKWLVNRNLTVGIADKEFPATDVVIINFDIVRKYQNRVNERNWDCVIVDECHNAKTAKAQRTKAIFGYKPKRDEDPKLASSGIPARYKIALTGTPIENCIDEMFPVLHWLDREKFRSKSALQKLAGKRYIPGSGMTEASQDGLANLQQYLRENIMIRRLKSDVLKELPPKTRTVVEFSTKGLEHLIRQEEEVLARTETERTAAQAALVVAKAGDNEDEYRKAIERLKEVSGFEFAEMARIRKETAVAKVPQMIEHLKAQLEETGKVLVFAHHTEALEALHAAFADQSVLIHGAHSQAMRDERVHRFMTDPACRLFFGSIRATGEGLTLTAATLVVFHEFDWVPSKMVQCEDRAHRIGQRDNVTVQVCVVPGTIDAQMGKTCVAKADIADRALDQVVQRRMMEEPPIVAKEWKPLATRKQLEDHALLVTDEQRGAVKLALQALAGVCDGARKIDGAGFNKLDSAIGKDLSMRGRLSDKQVVLGARLVRRYAKQLPLALVESATRNIAAKETEQ